MPLIGFYVLIVRESTAWTKACPEMLKKFGHIHFKKTYQIEEQLKEDVKASGAHEDLFLVEDAIWNFISLQKQRYRAPNLQPTVIRTCTPEKFADELCRFNPNWVITVGSNYTYINACQVMLSNVSIVGINAGPYRFYGSLCFGGRFSLALSLKDMGDFCLPRYRIRVEITIQRTRKLVSQNYFCYALNEIFIGNKNPEKGSKATIHVCANEGPKKTRFKEILMLTGSGTNFRLANLANTRASIEYCLDIHRHLDQKTANRVDEFQIPKISMEEYSDVFAVFTKQLTNGRRNDQIFGIKTRSMGLEIKSSQMFIVLDGIRKIKMPKGAVIKFIMEKQDALKTYMKV